MVKADASKHSAMSYKRMMEAEPKLAKLVEEWMDQAKRTDEQEDRKHGPDRRGDEIPAHIKDLTGSYPAQISADAGCCSEANIVAAGSGCRPVHRNRAAGHGTASPTDEADKVAALRTQAMREKLKAGGFESPYRLRKQVVEPVFGQIKLREDSASSCTGVSQRSRETGRWSAPPTIS
jgi:hypothetical protein